MTVATPDSDADGQSESGPLLQVEDLVKEFPIRKGLLLRQVGVVSAVAGVSFAIDKGETVGLVGESGCGKSTTGRAILRLVEPTSGSVIYDGTQVVDCSRSVLQTKLRRGAQMVFQDPFASLNPRMTVQAIIADPMKVHGLWKDGGPDRVKQLLELVGLKAEHVNRYPHEFSGGQRQRIGVARALATSPDLIVLDEPVSALDVSIQAGVVNLLDELQDELGIAYLFVAHDLSVVRHVSDRVAVMYLGKIVEYGPVESVFQDPQHPYTRALMSAVPVPDPRIERTRTRIVLEGDVPSPSDPPSGCRFRTRCWLATDRCAEEEPPRIAAGADPLHETACHFPGDRSKDPA
jgi:oligopeptide/dipeptide ABC transporter ATP-binding protein